MTPRCIESAVQTDPQLFPTGWAEGGSIDGRVLFNIRPTKMAFHENHSIPLKPFHSIPFLRQIQRFIMLLCMFQMVPCQRDGCTSPRVYSSEYCFRHQQDPGKYLDRIKKLLKEKDSFAGMVFDHIPFEEFDFSNKTFYLCTFSHSTFRDCTFQKTSFRLCFFDRAHFSHSQGENLNIYNSLFATARLEECTFLESNIILANCNWIECTLTSFKDCDLYNSRFIGARLDRVEFLDCNLLNTDFSLSQRVETTFKYCNLQDAILEPEDSV